MNEKKELTVEAAADVREMAEKLAKLPEHKKEIVLAFMQGLQYDPKKEQRSA